MESHTTARRSKRRRDTSQSDEEATRKGRQTVNFARFDEEDDAASSSMMSNLASIFQENQRMSQESGRDDVHEPLLQESDVCCAKQHMAKHIKYVHSLRVEKYGEEIADEFDPGHIPTEVRARFQEWLNRSLANLDQ